LAKRIDVVRQSLCKDTFESNDIIDIEDAVETYKRQIGLIEKDRLDYNKYVDIMKIMQIFQHYVKQITNASMKSRSMYLRAALNKMLRYLRYLIFLGLMFV